MKILAEEIIMKHRIHRSRGLFVSWVMGVLFLAPASAIFPEPIYGQLLQAAEGPTAQPSAPKEIEVIVHGGFQPNRITIPEGEAVRLTFERREHTPCTREVVFRSREQSLELRRELPPNQRVTIELPPLKAGEVEFRCGMNMLRGIVTVKARP